MNQANENFELRDVKWMRQALQEAKQAQAIGEVPIGAIAVFGGQVIGHGFNRKEIDGDPAAHAELIALRRAASWLGRWRLKGVTLYSTLEPCPMCAGAMLQARLTRLVYGAEDTRFGADGTVVNLLNNSAFNHQVRVRRGVLEEETAALLRHFFQQQRNSR